MDIWAWTYDIDDELRENGHERLADYMDRIPSDTVNGRHEEIDQYAEEAISMAREVGHPWVEIFLRHWRLQSTILVRQQPKDMVKEAVSLLEFSHRPDNLDCPQSICAVQDLANCYGAFDGPGFADERIEVCKENFARINPSWPCYSCIGGEYARALEDAERYNECIELLDHCDKELIEAGQGKDTGELLLVRLTTLAKQGKCEAARQYSKLARNSAGGENFKNTLKIYKAFIEMKDGRYNVAFNKLPSFDKVRLLASEHLLWAEVLYKAMLNDKEKQTAEHIQQLEEISVDMEKRGTYRQALLINGLLIELYRLNSENEKVKVALETMKRVKPKLNKDLGASELIQSFE